MWLIVAIFVLYLLMQKPQEGFMANPGANRQGCYPSVYKDYGTDSWHKYWHESKGMRVPTKFDNYVEGAHDYSCNRCYYPMAMPFN